MTATCQVITLPATGAERDAMRVLAKNSARPQRIVRVTGDSILYIDAADQPCTAWLHRRDTDTLVIRIVPGFPAFPPSDFPYLPETQ